ncbi:MAG: DUF2188 domain-containing protein [Pyrinomonadaceae bacterium]|nr:DUF2188 domain-containing protein [Pyrinomonadaceae bacterium]
MSVVTKKGANGNSKPKPKTTASKKAVARKAVVGKFIVAPKSGRWAVTDPSKTVPRSYATQAAAVTAATNAARNKNSEVIIHGKDGRIKQKLSTSKADALMLRVWKSSSKSSATSKKQ